jgi:hypothetical protein
VGVDIEVLIAVSGIKAGKEGVRRGEGVGPMVYGAKGNAYWPKANPPCGAATVGREKAIR